MRSVITTWLVETTSVQWLSWLVPNQLALLVLSYVTVLVVSVVLVRRAGLSVSITLRGLLLCLVVGVVGGHAASALMRPMALLNDPTLLVAFWRGGLSSLGTLGAGLLVFGLYLRHKKQKVWAYADILAPVSCLGLAIARVGCFMRGCDYGRLTTVPWGVRFPPDTPVFRAHRLNGWIGPYQQHTLPVHPYPLYLAAWDLLIFAIVVFVLKRGNGDGKLALLTGYLYFSGRFFIEFARSPYSGPALGWFNLSQLICLIAIVVLAKVGHRIAPSAST